MNHRSTLKVAIAVVAFILSGQSAANADSRELVSVADHHVFNSEEVVDGATILVRDFRKRQVNATLTSAALDPDTAYSIWWVVFNRPRYCHTPYACGLSDLEVFGGDPRVRASAFWGGGFVSDSTGTANTQMLLSPGRTTRERAAKTGDYGLQDLRGAEIHVVMRTHGPTGLAGTVATQIGTENEACPVEGCQNVFASIHPGNHR